MPSTSPAYPRNLDIAVGYSYNGNWMRRMAPEQFQAAKLAIKARADEIDPRRLQRLRELELEEPELLDGDKAPDPMDYPPGLYDALEHVMDHAQEAAEFAVHTLNDLNGLGLSPAPVKDCPGCVINVRTGVHSNTLRFELRDENGPVGVNLNSFVDGGAGAYSWVPLEVVIRWDCA